MNIDVQLLTFITHRCWKCMCSAGWLASMIQGGVDGDGDGDGVDGDGVDGDGIGGL